MHFLIKLLHDILIEILIKTLIEILIELLIEILIEVLIEIVQIKGFSKKYRFYIFNHIIQNVEIFQKHNEFFKKFEMFGIYWDTLGYICIFINTFLVSQFSV